jgi:transposase
MITGPAGIRVLVATRPVDFRKGGDGLAALVREALGEDPFSGTIFVFRSKRADRVKILAWDGSGLVLFWETAGARGIPLAADQRWHHAIDCVAARCAC